MIFLIKIHRKLPWTRPAAAAKAQLSSAIKRIIREQGTVKAESHKGRPLNNLLIETIASDC